MTKLLFKRAALKILIGLIFVSSHVIAQQGGSVTGVVTSEDGFSIPGVTIFIEGTQNGTTTDVQGKYKLNNVSPESTIVFSFIGMKTLEVKYSGQLVIDAVLESEVIGLDEIVIVGYGSQKKSVVTGSISTIGAKELKDVPVQRLIRLYRGGHQELLLLQIQGNLDQVPLCA